VDLDFSVKTMAKDWLRGLIYQAIYAVFLVIAMFLLAFGGMSAMAGIQDMWTLNFSAAALLVSAVVLIVWFFMTVISGKLITFLADLIPD